MKSIKKIKNTSWFQLLMTLSGNFPQEFEYGQSWLPQGQRFSEIGILAPLWLGNAHNSYRSLFPCAG